MDFGQAVSQASDVCVLRVSAEQGVAADLMLAVRSVERGKPGKSVRNSNATYDFNEPGLNTRTLDALGKQGWDVHRLINDGCYAMGAATYWMRGKLLTAVQTDQPLMARAARYNSTTAIYNVAYQRRLEPSLRAWACHLFNYWKTPAEQLFAIASHVMTEKELTTCKPQQNPY